MTAMEPVPSKSLLDVLAKLPPFEEDFPEIDDPLPRAIDL
jgi:hypothetical protein